MVIIDSNRKLVERKRSRGFEHAGKAGEMVTMLGGPPLKIRALLETEKHDSDDILQESLEHEAITASVYHVLLRLVEGEIRYTRRIRKRNDTSGGAAPR